MSQTIALTPAESLRQKIETRSAVVGVIGLGYVGLPLGMQFARSGHRVLGIDVDPQNAAHQALLDVGRGGIVFEGLRSVGGILHRSAVSGR